MRSGNNVGYAITGRHGRHFPGDRFFDRPVVERWQDMAVDVYHEVPAYRRRWKETSVPYEDSLAVRSAGKPMRNLVWYLVTQSTCIPLGG
jgi:hypothetical protein